ncbi:unnamed protein product [Blepharisma stoltei]|uniref:Uncharacterized protein n=1 Tax=Blepharisma stoltei TaxID=1481888 RepID=A0AAU9IGW0_9CILI|nr:unnamed protein product [Blepharisma stoltei]
MMILKRYYYKLFSCFIFWQILICSNFIIILISNLKSLFFMCLFRFDSFKVNLTSKNFILPLLINYFSSYEIVKLLW